jgi:hypothetical protein
VAALSCSAPQPSGRSRIDLAKRPLGRSERKPFADRADGRPESELPLKFYRQATNKIVGISVESQFES